MLPGLIQPFLVFIKSNSSDSSFKPFYVVSHGHFPALPQMNHRVEGTCWNGDCSGSASDTECKRADESAVCGSSQPLTSPRPVLRLLLHGALGLSCREHRLKTSLKNCSPLQQFWPMGADHTHVFIPDSALPSKSLPSPGHCSLAVWPGIKYSHLISLPRNSHLSKRSNKSFFVFLVFLAHQGKTVSCIVFVWLPAPGIAGAAAVQLHVVILYLMPWELSPQTPGAPELMEGAGLSASELRTFAHASISIASLSFAEAAVT